MASTIFFSNFDAGELCLGESPLITPPISSILTILYGAKTSLPGPWRRKRHGEKLAISTNLGLRRTKDRGH